MARLRNSWLALSCLLACVVALWSARKYYYVCTLLLCAGPIEGCSAVPAVLTYYGFRSLVCASWCSEEEKKQVQKLKLCCFVFLGGHIARRADDTASFVSKKSTSLAVMFTSRLVLSSAMTWTEKSACDANLPHLHKHTRARFLLLDVVMVLLYYCGWLWCCYYYYSCLWIALSSLLITCVNEKTKEKNVTKSKESKELREGSFPQQLIFSSAITGWEGLMRGGTICRACPPRWARSKLFLLSSH